MKYGFHAGYWSSRPPAGMAEAIALCDRCGLDSVWTAEAYGSDCLTPLAWWGSATSRVRLGTNILQLSARTPAATAMAALTLDHLSGGRFMLGLGVSGPQVVEGWYGQPYPRPLARTREYVEVVRAVLARDEPVTHHGEFYPLPFPGGLRLGKPLRSTLHPLRADLPILLAAEGPRNVALAAEIADGWLPMFFSPRMDAEYRAQLAEGFARPGARRGWDDFEIPCAVPVVVDDDLAAARDLIRPRLAFYIGGMGARTMNFHANLFARMGYPGEVAKIQELFLSGQQRDAVAVVPDALIDDVALVGPAARIREEFPRWEQSLVTTLIIATDPRSLPAVLDVLPGPTIA